MNTYILIKWDLAFIKVSIKESYLVFIAHLMNIVVIHLKLVYLEMKFIKTSFKIHTVLSKVNLHKYAKRLLAFKLQAQVLVSLYINLYNLNKILKILTTLYMAQ